MGTTKEKRISRLIAQKKPPGHVQETAQLLRSSVSAKELPEEGNRERVGGQDPVLGTALDWRTTDSQDLSEAGKASLTQIL